MKTMNLKRVKSRNDSMNKTEEAFYNALRLDPEILWVQYEPIKLRLADRTYYTPDFCSIYENGSLVFHEVKGFWRDDARVKIKVAAEQFPYFKFVAVSRNKGGWEYEYFFKEKK